MNSDAEFEAELSALEPILLRKITLKEREIERTRTISRFCRNKYVSPFPAANNLRSYAQLKAGVVGFALGIAVTCFAVSFFTQAAPAESDIFGYQKYVFDESRLDSVKTSSDLNLVFRQPPENTESFVNNEQLKAYYNAAQFTH